MWTLVLSTFLYACESWTLTAKIERRIQALEMRCYRRLLNISYKDHLTNEEVRHRIQNAIAVHDDLTMVKKWKLRCYGHISRSSGMANCRGQWKEQEGEEDRRKDGKITFKEWTGMEWSLEIPWGQRKTGKDRKVEPFWPNDIERFFDFSIPILFTDECLLITVTVLFVWIMARPICCFCPSDAIVSIYIL